MHVRKVLVQEENLVADVLGAAAAGLVDKGYPLWSTAEVSEVAVKEHVRAGMYYVAFDGAGPVGVFRFQLEDRHFWPESIEGSSAFVHKLAVHPRKQGHGMARALLSDACELAQQHGRRLLRLDCMGGRPKLRAIYEHLGFRHHSDKTFGNQLFHRFEIEVGQSKAADPQHQYSVLPQSVVIRPYSR